MISHSRAIEGRSRLVTAIRTVTYHRPMAVAVVAITLGLSLGACNRSSPTEAQESGSTASSAAIQGDVVGVTALVVAWDAAWNAGDASALAATFTEDGEFINGRGQLAIGAATIKANHTTSLGGVFRGSHTHGVVRKVTFLSENAAVVDVDNDLTNYTSLPPGTVPTTPGVQSGRHVRLVVRQGGVWRVKEMQLTSILPASPAP
ncbi:MAG: SgcJ/EcaC family oxidoreductase [bacterium]